MPYSTQADVETAAGGVKLLAQLADWDGDAEVDVARVTSAIAAADRTINRYAAFRHTVPLNPVPDGAKQLSAELAVYYLKKWRRVLDEHDMAWFETEVANDKGTGWLQQLGRGEVTWDTDPEPAKAARVRDDVHDLPSDRDTSRERTKGFW
jgi:phage gp36-like protein